MKKQNIMPVIVLTVICLVSALLMAAVNMIAAPIIEEAKNAAANAALLVVLPDGKNFEEIPLDEGFPKGITKAYRAVGGYVFEATVTGNKPEMVVMCGVDNDGKIVGIDIISHEETPSYFEKVEPIVSGTNGIYSGKTAEDLTPEIISGATNSSNGVYNAVKLSLDAYTVASGGELAPEPEQTLPKTDEEIIALAEALLSAETGTLINVTPEERTDVKRVYKDKSGRNYAVYTVVMSRYGYPETETLVYIGSDGIIKAVNKLTWKTSDAMYGYVPPTDEEVNPFYDRLVGATSDTIGEVELVSNATNTSTNLRNALAEAITVVNDLVAKDMPTAEEDIIALAEGMLGTQSGALINVTPADSEYIKRIYKDKSGKNYAVYTVVMSRYGYPETETLLHIGSDGVIKAVNKITWKTSDAMWGYVPPTDEEVNPFYDRLVGATSDTIGEVELVSNATTTSTNLINAITEAISEVKILAAKDMPTEESEVISLAASLLGTSENALTNVTPDGLSLVRRVWRDDKLGYAVYVAVISENYGTVETETLLHIGFDGVIKSVKRMVWKTSDAMWGYVPPTESEVAPFYERLVGKSLKNIESVEVVTNATTTSKNMLASVKEALETVGGFDFRPEGVPVARITGILILAAGIGAAVAYTATNAIIRRKRNEF